MNRHLLTAGLAAALWAGCGKQETAAPAAAIPPTLPGNICVVSGDKVGADGMKPVEFTYQGAKILFCCEDCRPTFEKNPDKYTAALKAGKAPGK